MGDRKYVPVTVEGDPPVGYTIGLLEHFNHPELVVAGMGSDYMVDDLHEAAGQIATGLRLVAGDVIRIDDANFTVGVVHPERWEREPFDLWHRYYEMRGWAPPASALQLIPPASLFCSCHAGRATSFRLDKAPKHWGAGIDAAHIRPSRNTSRPRRRR